MKNTLTRKERIARYGFDYQPKAFVLKYLSNKNNRIMPTSGDNNYISSYFSGLKDVCLQSLKAKDEKIAKEVEKLSLDGQVESQENIAELLAKTNDNEIRKNLLRYLAIKYIAERPAVLSADDDANTIQQKINTENVSVMTHLAEQFHEIKKALNTLDNPFPLDQKVIESAQSIGNFYRDVNLEAATYAKHKQAILARYDRLIHHCDEQLRELNSFGQKQEKIETELERIKTDLKSTDKNLQTALDLRIEIEKTSNEIEGIAIELNMLQNELDKNPDNNHIKDVQSEHQNKLTDLRAELAKKENSLASIRAELDDKSQLQLKESYQKASKLLQQHQDLLLQKYGSNKQEIEEIKSKLEDQKKNLLNNNELPTNLKQYEKDLNKREKALITKGKSEQHKQATIFLESMRDKTVPFSSYLLPSAPLAGKIGEPLREHIQSINNRIERLAALKLKLDSSNKTQLDPRLLEKYNREIEEIMSQLYQDKLILGGLLEDYRDILATEKDCKEFTERMRHFSLAVQNARRHYYKAASPKERLENQYGPMRNPFIMKRDQFKPIEFDSTKTDELNKICTIYKPVNKAKRPGENPKWKWEPVEIPKISAKDLQAIIAKYNKKHKLTSGLFGTKITWTKVSSGHYKIHCGNPEQMNKFISFLQQEAKALEKEKENEKIKSHDVAQLQEEHQQESNTTLTNS